MLRRMLRACRPITRRLALAPRVLLEEMPDAPGLFTQYRELLATGHKRVPGGWIYDGDFYPDYLTVGGASCAIRPTALQWCQGRGIDMGAGLWQLPGAVPIDIESGPGVRNSLQSIPDASQDFVFSSHCLEHIADWQAALRGWVAKLRRGGVLFLYLPHPSCKLWLPSNPAMAQHHKWSPTPEMIKRALDELGIRLVAGDDGPDHYYSFYVCGRLHA